MATAAEKKKKTTSYDVLVAARRLIDAEKITLKELAERIGVPVRGMQAMLAPGYQNMSLDRIDALKDVVRELRQQS